MTTSPAPGSPFEPRPLTPKELEAVKASGYGARARIVIGVSQSAPGAHALVVKDPAGNIESWPVPGAQAANVAAHLQYANGRVLILTPHGDA